MNNDCSNNFLHPGSLTTSSHWRTVTLAHPVPFFQSKSSISARLSSGHYHTAFLDSLARDLETPWKTENHVRSILCVSMYLTHSLLQTIGFPKPSTYTRTENLNLQCQYGQGPLTGLQRTGNILSKPQNVYFKACAITNQLFHQQTNYRV